MSNLEESTSILQLKVRLLGISPMIWRRVLVPASVTLHEPHGILQVSMGWEGVHLYYLFRHSRRCALRLLRVAYRKPGHTPLPVPQTPSFRLPLRHGGLLGARGPRRAVSRPESEEDLPCLHRRFRILSARKLRRPSRVPGRGRKRWAMRRGLIWTWSSVEKCPARGP